MLYFVDLIGVQNHVDDPEQDWPIDRAGSAERKTGEKKRATKKLRTGKEEMLDRVDKLLSSNTEAMKTLNKVIANQEVLVEQNAKSVEASQEIASSQLKIADSFILLVNLFQTRQNQDELLLLPINRRKKFSLIIHLSMVSSSISSA